MESHDTKPGRIPMGSIIQLISLTLESMKGILSIAFALFYLVFNTGVAINVNYCGDKVSSVELSALEGGTCCGPMAAMSCCSSETHIFQVAEEHQSTTSPLIVPPAADEAPQVEQVLKLDDRNSRNRLFSDSDPPDKAGPPPYLKFCRLTLYG
jgi:hypothetical protein